MAYSPGEYIAYCPDKEVSLHSRRGAANSPGEGQAYSLGEELLTIQGKVAYSPG